jgi:hypothetical protein
MHTLSFAQDNTEKHRTYIIIDFTQSGIQKKLMTTLTARIKGERGRKKIADAEIEFYTVLDTSDIFLGKATTNADGVAILEISADQTVLPNSDREFRYSVLFRGNDIYNDVSKSITLKEVNMDVSFIEIDSIKNIVVTVFELDASGEEIPVEEDIIFYVPRQFSLLKIGEVELQEGNGMIEFPVTLPGDSIGNLKIIARIEESREYGTVEVMGVKDWGNPRLPVIVEARRGLGDTDAPLWMVYTLIILLSAVWFHYMYLVYVLIVIKRKGKNPNLA